VSAGELVTQSLKVQSRVLCLELESEPSTYCDKSRVQEVEEWEALELAYRVIGKWLKVLSPGQKRQGHLSRALPLHWT
jgi:hypothetical protein